MSEQVDVVEKLEQIDSTEVVFSFDTTGSMSPCVEDVKSKLHTVVAGMFKNIKGLRVGIITHGDYCDGANCIRTLDLTDNVDTVLDFINGTPSTSGGDADECYELALHKARGMSWTNENGAAFVLIGDASPHEPNYYGNTDKLDWRVELNNMRDAGIRVYAMQCLRHSGSRDNNFWEAVAEIAGTPLLQLSSFNESTAALGAVAYSTAVRASSENRAAYREYRTSMCDLGASDSMMTNIRSLAIDNAIEDGDDGQD